VELNLILPAIILLILGVVGGFLAGLLGIGGGAIFVPGLYYILRGFGYHENAMHIAVGTSLLTIIFTGTSSAYAHYKKNAIDFNLLRNFLPGVFCGVILGTVLADLIPSNGLKSVFATSQIVFGSYMILRTNKANIFQSMPRQPWFTLASTANACLATLMGVGGGVQNVTFMTICNVNIKQAIATAASIGPFIAAIGSLGFVYIGFADNNLPPYSIGYLNIAAFLTIVATSVLTAPLGAKLSHSLPVPKIKRCFAIFMLLVATKMLFEAIVGESIYTFIN